MIATENKPHERTRREVKGNQSSWQLIFLEPPVQNENGNTEIRPTVVEYVSLKQSGC